jgi:hypothetical protein
MITVDNEREIVVNEVINFINISKEKSNLAIDMNLSNPQLIVKHRDFN